MLTPRPTDSGLPVTDAPLTEIEVRVLRPANGGAGVGNDADGRTTFCDGALTGELVRVGLTQQKKRFARGVVTEVIEAAPERIEAACPTHHSGCGGCDLAHAEVTAQRDIKAHVVRDSLGRIGRFASDEIDAAWVGFVQPEGEGWYRTTARLGIRNGKLGYRASGSHTIIPAEACGVVHPLVEEVIRDGHFPATSGPEVVVRASHATGERIVIVDGSASGVKVPADVTLLSQNQLDAGAEASFVEDAGGRSWLVSANSFFQAGPRVATNLVDAVRAAAGDVTGKVLVDAYCGVGLFAGTVGVDAASVTAIELSASSARDARGNLGAQTASGQMVDIVEMDVVQWEATPANVVIADPSRAGLGADGVDALVASGAATFVLVSCDTGSFGRDAGLLRDAGYALDSVRLVDAFRDTSHVETVASFVK